ncbi:hypothetical protein VME_45670 [Vibrio harveyi 1DA3]|nr:hypothetical protein VME_45670 [Vibrio harveyi 1DA3]
MEYNKDKTSLDLIKLSGKYTTGKTAFGIGYDLGKIESGKDRVDLNNFYANATYAFNSNLKAYGEIGYLSSDELEKAIKSSGADLGVNYTVGAEFSF